MKKHILDYLFWIVVSYGTILSSCNNETQQKQKLNDTNVVLKMEVKKDNLDLREISFEKLVKLIESKPMEEIPVVLTNELVSTLPILKKDSIYYSKCVFTGKNIFKEIEGVYIAVIESNDGQKRKSFYISFDDEFHYRDGKVFLKDCLKCKNNWKFYSYVNYFGSGSKWEFRVSFFDTTVVQTGKHPDAIKPIKVERWGIGDNEKFVLLKN